MLITATDSVTNILTIELVDPTTVLATQSVVLNAPGDSRSVNPRYGNSPALADAVNLGLVVVTPEAGDTGSSQAFQTLVIVEGEGGTVLWDVSRGPAALLVLTESVFMQFPANMTAGQTYILSIQQAGEGGNTISWHEDYAFPGANSPTLSGNTDVTDVVTFFWDGTRLCSLLQAGFLRFADD